MYLRHIVIIVIFLCLLIGQIAFIGFSYQSIKNPVKAVSDQNAANSDQNLDAIYPRNPDIVNRENLFLSFSEDTSTYSTKYTLSLINTANNTLEKTVTIDLDKAPYPIKLISSNIHNVAGSKPFIYNPGSGEIYMIADYYDRYDRTTSINFGLKSVIFKFTFEDPRLQLVTLTYDQEIHYAVLDSNLGELIIATFNKDQPNFETFLSLNLSQNTPPVKIAEYNADSTQPAKFSDIKYIPSQNKIYQIINLVHAQNLKEEEKFKKLLIFDLSTKSIQTQNIPADDSSHVFPNGISGDGLTLAFLKGSIKPHLMIHDLTTGKTERTNVLGEITNYNLSWSADNENLVLDYTDSAKIYNINYKNLIPLPFREVLGWYGSHDKIIYKNHDQSIRIFDLKRNTSAIVPNNSSQTKTTNLIWYNWF